MELSRSLTLTPSLIWLDSARSTNAELMSLAASQKLPELTVLATANQMAGRGRAGRSWVTPEGKALAISILLRPPMAAEAQQNALGWLPLLAGLAMTEALAGLLPASSSPAVKWPNDVLVEDRKLCGVLSELSAELGVVVVGAGVNLTQTAEELPIAAAISLEMAGAELPSDEAARFDLVLSNYLERFNHRYRDFLASGLNAQTSGLHQAVAANCISLGKPVRAILPDQTELIGLAVGIDDTGRLQLEVSGKLTALGAGDIVHLRH